MLASVARECSRVGRPFRAPSVLLGCGGETTVALAKDGKFHSGGPNQEVALSFALGLHPSDRVAAAFLDTDGEDGGTNFAGALVDGTPASGASELDLNIHAALRAHEASGVLERLGGLVFTGPTHTNVNDLFTVVIG